MLPKTRRFLTHDQGRTVNKFPRWGTEKQLIEGDVGVCLSNPLQPLDLTQHKFVELLGFCNFHDGEYVAGAPTRIGHLDSRKTREPPRHVARLTSFRCNDDVGSHAPPSTGLC